MSNERKNSEPVRPLCLELLEAEADIVNAINAAAKQIPFYLLESIVTKAARQVSENAKAEREKARQIYNNQLEEYNNSKGDTE